MSAEGYIANEGLAHAGKEHTSRVETIPLFRERRNELTTQTLSRRAIDQEQGVYVSLDRNENASFHNSPEKTAQVVTLATIELLAGGASTAVGGVLGSVSVHSLFTTYQVFTGALLPVPGTFLPIVTLTLTAVSIGLMVAGMNHIGAATRRLRSLF